MPKRLSRNNLLLIALFPVALRTSVFFLLQHRRTWCPAVRAPARYRQIDVAQHPALRRIESGYTTPIPVGFLLFLWVSSPGPACCYHLCGILPTALHAARCLFALFKIAAGPGAPSHQTLFSSSLSDTIPEPLRRTTIPLHTRLARRNSSHGYAPRVAVDADLT
jgi:hypothetical protein